MLAELHGKISRSGSNLRTTSEDNLTGNVFGILRYVSFNHLMKPLLLSSLCATSENTLQSVKATLKEINLDFWNENIEFWPYDKEGELDVLLKFNNAVIGIEVKYNSPMSDQDDDSSMTTPGNIGLSKEQLPRESRIVKRFAGKRKAILILLAKKQFAKATVTDMLTCSVDGLTPQKIESDVELCYIGWEDFLEALKKEYRQCAANDFTSLIVSDLIELLTLKGFEQFRSFDVLETFGRIAFNDGYYEFQDNIATRNNNISFYYKDEIIKEDFYEFAHRE